MTEEELRKIRSEGLISNQEIPVNIYLPCVENSTTTTIRSVKDIAYRTLCLLVVALKAEGLEKNIVDNIIIDYQLNEYFTPDENEFIQNINPTQKDIIQNTWRYESALVLLWSLGYIDKLSLPNDTCDASDVINIMKETNINEFITEAKIRSTDEILDEVDLIYRYHWAVVEARLKGYDLKDKLNSSVVYERHYALNWLIHYGDQEWDDITTDT